MFAEAAWQRNENQKWVAGLRHDQVKAHYDTNRVTDPVLKHQKYNLRPLQNPQNPLNSHQDI